MNYHPCSVLQPPPQRHHSLYPTDFFYNKNRGRMQKKNLETHKPPPTTSTKLQTFAGIVGIWSLTQRVMLSSHPSLHYPHEFFGGGLFFAMTPATAAEDKAADQEEDGNDRQNTLLWHQRDHFFLGGGGRVFASYTTT